MSPRLTLTVLVENSTLTDHDFCGEAGLSFLLETAGKKILFDTRLSGLFLTNAEKMGIDLGDLDFLVFSHGHIDRTGGLWAHARFFTRADPERIQHRIPEHIAHSAASGLRIRKGGKTARL